MNDRCFFLKDGRRLIYEQHILEVTFVPPTATDEALLRLGRVNGETSFVRGAAAENLYGELLKRVYPV